MNLTVRRVQDTHPAISFAINLPSILATTAKFWSLASLPPVKDRARKLELRLRFGATHGHQSPTIQS